MRFLILVLIIGFFLPAQAQLPAHYNQYHFNAMVLNPAYAGSNEVLHAVALGRKQWLGFPGAPLSFSFSLDSPLRDEKNNFSLVLAHDQIGATQRQLFVGGYAYRLDLGRGKLAFGLQGGIEAWRTSVSSVYTVDPGDQLFDGDVRQVLVPRFGFGVRYETSHFFLDLSAPQLLWINTSAMQLLSAETIRRRYYFARAGFSLPLAKDWELVPMTLFKYESGFDPQVDVGLLLSYREKYWAGPMYRTNGDLIFQAAFQLNDQLRFGYAYDFQTSALRSISNGSHSLSITYDFIYKVSTSRPRYF